MGTSKQASWSASALTLLMWCRRSSPSCILHVKSLQRMKRMLDKLCVSRMLQSVFHASAGPLHLLMWWSWLSTKLMPMIDMAFFTCRWYSLMILGSALDGGASSNPSTISQRSMEANTISILNFQKLKFSPLNLSMTLALSPSNDASLHSNSTSLPTYVLNQMLISV